MFNWGFVGPEGAGKSIGMTYINLLHLAKGGRVVTFPGYDIYNGYQKDKDGNRIRLSEPVTMAQMVTTPLSQFSGAIVTIDEIDQFMDSNRTMTTFNLLMSYVAKQRRRAGMGFTYTLQEWNDLYFRMRNKTHYLTLCWDLYWSPWGKSQGLQRGEMMRWTTYDCLGFLTGKPWTQLKPKVLRAKPVRDYYDSFAPIDIFEGMKKIEVVKETTRIDLRPERLEAPSIPADQEPAHQEMDRKILDDLMDQGVSPKTLGVLVKRFGSD